MSQLTLLKAAVSLRDVADLLEFQSKALAYILYKKPSATKYNSFDVPKRGGGVRSIKAPAAELALLQRRLSNSGRCDDHFFAMTARGFFSSSSVRNRTRLLPSRRWVAASPKSALEPDLKTFEGAKCSSGAGFLRGTFVNLDEATRVL
jgi:hypothetical protein